MEYIFFYSGIVGFVADYFFLYTWQTPANAIEFYEQKVKELDTNLTELEKVVQTKSSQQRVFEEG